MTSQDKAGVEYWSDVWKNSPLTPPINYTGTFAKDYTSRILNSIYQKVFSKVETSGKKLLEVGCGNSSWLSYFARAHKMVVSGIDYSETGCEQSRKILQRDGVNGSIYFGDFFHPPPEVPRDYDFVYSGGVVEHFEDTTSAVRAFAGYLKSGGIMITTLPNMAGFGGWIQKIFNKPVYDTHVPLTLERTIQAHQEAGLEIVHAQYYGSISLYINLESVNGEKVNNLFLKKLITKALSVFSMSVWKLESLTGKFPPSSFLSPGMVVIARSK